MEAVDRAWMLTVPRPWGPWASWMLLDWAWSMTAGCTAKTRAPSRFATQSIELLQPMVERGELGMPSGSGFYHYPEPAYQQAGFLDAGTELTDLYRHSGWRWWPAPCWWPPRTWPTRRISTRPGWWVRLWIQVPSRSSRHMGLPQFCSSSATRRRWAASIPRRHDSSWSTSY